MSDLVVPIDVVGDAIAVTAFIAFVLGVVFAVFLLYIKKNMEYKNFKGYLGNLSEKEKLEYVEKLVQLEDHLEDIARGSNTKMFGRMYNKIVDFNSYIKHKWIQS